MPPGDDLIIIFLLSSAFLAGLEAMKASGWRIWAFGVLSGAFVCAGIGWHWLKDVYPPFTGWMSAIVTNPESWFILLVLGLVWLATTGRKGKKPFERDGNRDEIDETTKAVAELARKVAFVSGRIDNLRIPTPYDDSDLRSSLSELEGKASNTDGGLQMFMHISRESFDQIREDVKKVRELEKNIARNNGKIHEYERAHIVALNSLVEQMSHSLLFDSVPQMPRLCSFSDLNVENLKVEEEKAKDYWRQIARALTGTQWAHDLDLINQSAESAAQNSIREIPISERPTEIDPLDLLRYAIFKVRCEHCAAFLDDQKSNAYGTYRACLSKLRDVEKLVAKN
jgi:hypothetical protein